MSGGYITAILFGILWIIAMICSMIYLFYFHFKQPRGNFNHSRILKPLKLSKLKNDKFSSYSCVTILQLFAIVAIMIPVLLLSCLAVANISYLSRSISLPANTYIPGQTDQITSILPAIKKSLGNVRNYFSNFANEARINTAHVVEEIVEATNLMQEATMTNFNDILMSRLGVSQTFKYGDEMTNVVVQFFNHSKQLLEIKQEYKELSRELYPRLMNPDFGIFKLIILIRQIISQLPVCDEACKDFKGFFDKNFDNSESFADTDFASSFMFIMKQRNETRESVEEKSAHGRNQMKVTMEKSKKRMESLINISTVVRNITAKTWTKMDLDFQKAVTAIDRVSESVSSEETSATASAISLGLVLLLITPLIFIIVVIVLAVALVCLGASNARLRLAVYANLSLISFCVLVAMASFLIGGTMETELCRYLRTEQPVIVSSNGSTLVLDSDLNRVFVPTNLRFLPKSEFPTPLPHDALYGLIHRCRENEPILAAIGAIEHFDARALSKPQDSQRIIDVGRTVLLDSLLESDPQKMMPADMEDTLSQASQMDMFKDIDIDANIAKIPQSPIFERRDQVMVSISTSEFIDRIEKFIDRYGSLVKDDKKRDELKQLFKTLLLKLERFKLVTDSARQVYRSLRTIPRMEPIVVNLQSSLKTMLSLMKNKTRLTGIANQLYDEHIVKTTPVNSANIMAKFGPRMMGQLGHCRPLFDAYQSTVDTVCDVTVAKINAYWLYLGTIVLLVTIFLSTILITMIRTTPWFNGVSSDLEAIPNSKTHGDLLLQDSPREDGDKYRRTEV